MADQRTRAIPFLFKGFWGDWLLHLLFWSILLLICTMPGWDWMYFSGDDGSLWVAILYGYLFNASLFYGNAFLLYPRFYSVNRWLFWVLSLSLLLICQFLEISIDGIFGSFLLRVPTMETATALAKVGFFQTFIVNTAFWLLGIAYHLPLELLRKKREHQTLAEEKLKAELAFLKAQINPHSLFNGINSIYHLIDQKPILAKDMLLQFSELLRYQLYECKEDFIGLDKELLNIQNYIHLEEIRKGKDAKISTSIPVVTGQWQIAPLLLIPFIENAFKFLSHHSESEQNVLSLQIALNEGKLIMNLFNTFHQADKQGSQVGGIGLENARRRLNLIYPSENELSINKEKGRFEVYLKLPLKK